MIKKGVVSELIEVLASPKKKDNERKRWAANIVAMLSLNNGGWERKESWEKRGGGMNSM